MSRATISRVASLLIALTACIARGDMPFSSDPWLADLDVLERAMAERYPNLEWHAQRGLDLRAIDQRARQRLAAAQDAAAARRALERFIANFGDGHLSLTWPTPPMGTAPSRSPPSSEPLCQRLGFRADADTTAIVRDLPGYASIVNGAVVGAGVLTLGTKSAGVLRVREFTPDVTMCEQARATLHLAPDAACDESCEETLRTAAGNRFVGEIAKHLAALRAHDLALLIVDIAGNGGGDATALVLARMLAGDVPAPRMKFARTPERAKALALDIEELARARLRARGAERALLARLETALRLAAAPAPACDLMPLWRGERVTCTNLVGGPFFAAGLSEHEIAPEYRRRSWVPFVSATARFDELPRSWTGPIMIVVDGNSGSAAELFAAMLQDAASAIIVGSPTAGAGCGWTLPRHTVELPASGGHLDMPDCLRLRRDGINELDGIEPDILVGFRPYDSPVQRARRLDEVLRRWQAGDDHQ